MVSRLSDQGEDFLFNQEIATGMRHLWNTPQIRHVYERQSEFQFYDSAAW